MGVSEPAEYRIMNNEHSNDEVNFELRIFNCSNVRCSEFKKVDPLVPSLETRG